MSLVPIPYPRSLARQIYFACRYGAKVHSANVSFNSVIEKGAVIAPGCVISKSKIGSYSYLNRNVEVLRAEVGPFCSLGQGCLINPNEHFPDLPTSCEALYGDKLLNAVAENNKRKVVLGPDVWVGARAIVLKGVNIGVGAVIGAGAIITKDVPPYGIAVGIPARTMRFRFSQECIEALLNSRWWEYPITVIREALASAASYSSHEQPLMFAQAINERYGKPK